MTQRIAVVGASLAGVRVIKALHRKGFDGQIALIGDEAELPYDRPPLSKQFLTAVDPVPVKLLEPESFYQDVDLRLGVRAQELRPAEGAVVLADGTQVRADHIVIATGAGARPLPILPDGERVARLRTAADARKIRSALTQDQHILIVGGGFIGCEVAASARKRGLAVTIVEPASAPVVRGVGALVGNTIAAVHRDNGVDVRLGVTVHSVQGLGDRQVVTLTDGSRLETGFIVVGVGAVASTGWLAGNGFDLANGIRCDDRGRVVGGGRNLWAVGDVAAWPSERFGFTRRIEHWTNAVEQASILAANLLGQGNPIGHDPVPYVWSDQYEHKIQILGNVNGTDDTTMLRGSLEDRRFSLAYSRGGLLQGLVALNLPREIVLMRPLIAARAPLADVA